MCGIAGIASLDGSTPGSDRVRRMTDLIRHRGPDGEGLMTSGAVAFGHRRLAIIDPKGGQQPIADVTGRYVLTYNGEIYNYRELRQELPEFEFQTESDTEVLLHAYQKWGIECLGRLRGMFAFAIYDGETGIAHVVRDRLGIKPLYYGISGGAFVFASELAALAETETRAPDIRHQSIADYLHLQYVPTPTTIYERFKKLPPATYAEIDTRKGTHMVREYWSLEQSLAEKSDDAVEDALDRLLREAVEIYVRSDVPFGAFLSGGIDSSVISSYVHKVLKEPLKTFTIGFDHPELSEITWAQQAADIIGTDHEARIVSPEMAIDVLRKIVRHFGEPFGDSSAVPTYYVSQCAAAKVKMVLSGDGADELFAGYHSYPDLFAMARAARGRPGVSQWIGALFGGEQPSVDLQYQHDIRRQVFACDDVARLVGAASYSPPSPPRYPGKGDEFTQLQYQDVKTYLLDDILTKVDRMSMANSLELRVPYLEHFVVEFAFSLALSHRLRWDDANQQAIGKYALKRLAGRIFPPQFINRRKMGFGIPVQEWMAGPLRPLLSDIVATRSHVAFDFLSRDQVMRVFNDFWSGRSYGAGQAWVLMMLLLWFEYRRDYVEAPADEGAHV